MHKSPLLAMLLLSACAVGPDYEKPVIALPQHWPWEDTAKDKDAAPQASAQETINTDWWTAFNDPVLTGMIEEGIGANTDLARAAASVSAARAQLSFTDAAFFPSVNGQAGVLRTSNSQEALFSGLFRPQSKPFNTFSLAATLNYEIDLWGKLRRASESAQAQLLSAKANQDAVRLAVASDIGVAYFNLRALDAQLVVTQNTIKSRKESMEYQQKQAHAGAVNNLIYKQSEAELADAQAQLPALEQLRREQETALAILLGRSPQDMVEKPIARGQDIDTLPTPPAIPAGLPSTLLERRPDIQVAEQALVSANADIGVAKADYFPTLSLSGLLGLQSVDRDRLLRGSARYWNSGATLAAPIVDFGRVTSNVETAESRKDDARAQYQRAVQQAFKETLDSMAATSNSDARIAAQTAQETARAETLRLSQLRFNSGYINYLELLDAQRFLFQAQLNRITARRDRLVASINLYKALGGGWPENVKSNVKSATPAPAESTPEPTPTPTPAETPTPTLAPTLAPTPAATEADAPL